MLKFYITKNNSKIGWANDIKDAIFIANKVAMEVGETTYIEYQGTPIRQFIKQSDETISELGIPSNKKQFFLTDVFQQVVIGRNSEVDILVGEVFTKVIKHKKIKFPDEACLPAEIEKEIIVNLKITGVNIFGKEIDRIPAGYGAAITLEGDLNCFNLHVGDGGLWALEV